MQCNNACMLFKGLNANIFYFCPYQEKRAEACEKGVRVREDVHGKKLGDPI